MELTGLVFSMASKNPLQELFGSPEMPCEIMQEALETHNKERLLSDEALIETLDMITDFAFQGIVRPKPEKENALDVEFQLVPDDFGNA